MIQTNKNKLFAGILGILILIVLGSIILKYDVKPSETYSISTNNIIGDGDFESFNKVSGDCCNADPNSSRVFASRSKDSFAGNYSLNLTSESQCACVNIQIPNPSSRDRYILSFYSKGDNPRICNWVIPDRICIPEIRLERTSEWLNTRRVLKFTDISMDSKIYFYADNPRGQGVVTNLYDDVQVRKLIPIETPKEYKFDPEKEYIFKTKSDNNIHNAEMIGDIDSKTGEAYFLTKGEPYVTIRFPWSEIVIVLVILFFAIRLLVKNDEKK